MDEKHLELTLPCPTCGTKRVFRYWVNDIFLCLACKEDILIPDYSIYYSKVKKVEGNVYDRKDFLPSLGERTKMDD